MATRHLPYFPYNLVALALSGLLSAAAVRPSVETRSPSVTTVLRTIEYCKSDDETDSAKLSLSFIVTNTGPAPLVHLGRATVVRAMASRTKAELTQQRFETEWVGTLIFGEGREKAGDLSVLQPGAHFEFSDAVTLLAARAGASPRGMLQPGSHWLQLQLLPINAAAMDLERVRAAAKSRGTLWETAVLTQPMEFTIESNRVSPPCKSLE
jgi:hypothetical protein